MKLSIGGVAVEKSAITTTQKFGIDNPAIIIDFLRNRIYSNKIRVICQEYMCNARDAHRELGKEDVPIYVKAPTIMDSTFYVRDYGPGISPERMSKVFCLFGASTKNTNDNETGGFGLGAKSAWSYIDQYSVTTFIDGVKRYYSMSIDETQMGEMNLLHEEDTDEENGTLISVPIKEADIKSFSEWIVYSCAHWKTKPNIDRITREIKWIDYDSVKLSGTDWKIIESNVTTYCYSSHDKNRNEDISIKNGVPGFRHNCSGSVVLDGIHYPLNSSVLFADKNNCGDNPAQTLVVNFNILLYFKTGEIDVSISREVLEYNNKTKDAILNKLAVAVKEFSALHENDISNAKSLWHAMAKFNSYNYQTKNVIKKSLLWKKTITIPESISISSKIDCHEIDFDIGKFYGFKRSTVTGSISSHFTKEDCTNPQYKIVINDNYSKNSAKNKLISVLMNEFKHKHIFLLSPKYECVGKEFSLKTEKQKAAILKEGVDTFTQFLSDNKIENFDVVNLSSVTLPKVMKTYPQEKRGPTLPRKLKTNEKRIGYFTVEKNSDRIDDKVTKDAVIPEDITGYYIVSKGCFYNFFNQTELLSNDSFRKSVAAAARLLLGKKSTDKVDKIYIIPERLLDSFSKNNNIKKLDDALEEKIKGMKNSKEDESVLRKTFIYSKTTDSYSESNKWYQSHSLQEIISNSKVYKKIDDIKKKNSKLLDYLKNYHFNKDENMGLYVMIERYKSKLGIYNTYSDEIQKVQDIAESYPVFQFLDRWKVNSKGSDNAIINYVNAIDKSNN